MTDLEISKALALAIGWPEYLMFVAGGKLRCGRNYKGWSWQVFDYRDWNAIAPIAERYDCFPQKGGGIFGEEYWWSCIDGLGESYANTPQEAIALAVIAARGNHAN